MSFSVPIKSITVYFSWHKPVIFIFKSWQDESVIFDTIEVAIGLLTKGTRLTETACY